MSVRHVLEEADVEIAIAGQRDERWRFVIVRATEHIQYLLQIAGDLNFTIKRDADAILGDIACRFDHF